MAFEIGDKVLLSTRNLALKGALSRKLSARHVGPFIVVAKYGNTAYKLKLPENMKIHPVFHVSLLKAYKGVYNEPDAVEIEDEKEYEIDQIVGHALRQGQMHYLVTWVGYDQSHNQYLPESALGNAQR